MIEKEKYTKRCYVCGPYRAPNVYLQKMNIRKAEKTAVLLWSWGWVPICPHKNAEFFEGAYGMTDDIFLKGDLIFLEVCDIVVVLPGWRYSEGTLTEIARAEELGIPVYYWENESDRTYLRTYYAEWRD